ncbi:ATP-binding protein [Marinimicrobium sp. ABcell2]|uniref:ATP-binding protein n=1 Tax=Marinimicrobium sp. ABcell2 TaxID=3069751 RepID=UPI0027B6D397|nr:ATP-binding protein [Marinimicrobium sp. ABcell2]MDQ2077833.1 ATP-binding protein [Marinimicrobium sp. ABcell2]
MTQFDPVLKRLEQLLDRVEALVPPLPPETDWHAQAFRWRTAGRGGYLQAVRHPHRIELDALQNIEPQKASIVRNTERFLAGLPANNVLLTGARGTGKSSLIKACWNHFSATGLKLLEVDKADLLHLGDIVEQLEDRPEKFLLFCDDLSFEEGEVGYKLLKSALDGSIAAPSDNILFYATSNRRHLLPQNMRENLDVSYEDGELRPTDSTEEKVSLSDRFGLWLSFYPFSQDEYLAAAEHWVVALGGHWDSKAERAALLWHRTRGARSGRVAWQFSRDYVESQ